MPSNETHAQRRFGGMQRLYGVDGAARIAQAHVAVVGIGGVGSWVAEALARSGIGALTLVDLDNVAESNINRQIHAHTESIGMPKVLAMQQRIALIHPGCEVHGIEDFVEEDNVQPLLGGDGIDAKILHRAQIVDDFHHCQRHPNHQCGAR